MTGGTYWNSINVPTVTFCLRVIASWNWSVPFVGDAEGAAPCLGFSSPLFFFQVKKMQMLFPRRVRFDLQPFSVFFLCVCVCVRARGERDFSHLERHNTGIQLDRTEASDPSALSLSARLWLRFEFVILAREREKKANTS